MFIRRWPAVAFIGLVACGPPHAELRRPTPDPADLGAPEAPTSPASKTLTVSLQAPIPLAPFTPLAVSPSLDIAAKIPSSYTCPMHPEVHSDQPGKCPKCGMELIPETKSPPKNDAPMKAMPMDGMKDMKDMKDMKHRGRP